MQSSGRNRRGSGVVVPPSPPPDDEELATKEKVEPVPYVDDSSSDDGPNKDDEVDGDYVPDEEVDQQENSGGDLNEDSNDSGARKQLKYASHTRQNIEETNIQKRKRAKGNAMYNYQGDFPEQSDSASSPGSGAVCRAPKISRRVNVEGQSVGGPSERVRRGDTCKKIDPGVPKGTNISFRCNVNTTISAIRELNLKEWHLEAARRVPCWYFIDAAVSMPADEIKRYMKYDAGMIDIINTFVSKNGRGQKGFKFGRDLVMPLGEHVELILGVRGGAVPINVASKLVRQCPFSKRCWSHMTPAEPMSKNKIYAILKIMVNADPAEPHVVDDVARLLHMYVMGSLFTANNNNSVCWQMLKYLDDLDKICDYDWGNYILEYLMTSVEKTKSLRTSGCAVFLLFWLCEICPLIKPQQGVQHFPRFRKWSIPELSFELAHIDLSKLNTTLGVDVARLCPTKQECDYLDEDDPAIIPIEPIVTKEDRIEVEEQSLVGSVNLGGCPSETDASIVQPRKLDKGKNIVCEMSERDTVGELVAVSHVNMPIYDNVIINNIGEGIGSDMRNPVDAKDMAADEVQLHTWAALLESASNVGTDFDVEMMRGMLPGNVGVSGAIYTQGSEPSHSSCGKLEIEMNELQLEHLNKSISDSATYIRALELRMGQKDEIMRQVKRLHEIEIARTRQLHDCRVVEMEGSFNKVTADLFEEAAARHEISKQLQYEIELKAKSQIAYQGLERNYTMEKTNKESVMQEYDAMAARVNELQDLVKDLNEKIDCQALELARRQAVIDKLEISDEEDPLTPKEPKQVAAGISPYHCPSGAVNPQHHAFSSKLVPYVSSTASKTPVKPKSALRTGGGYITPIKPAILFPGNSPRSESAPRSSAIKKRVTFKTPIGETSTGSIKKCVTALNKEAYGHLFTTPPAKANASCTDADSMGETVMNSESPITEEIKKARMKDHQAEKEVEKVAGPKNGVVLDRMKMVTNQNKIRPFVYRPECPAVKYVGQKVTNWMAKKFQQRNPGETILRVNTSTLRAELNLEDFERMLNHDRYTDSILDAWGMVHVTRSCGARLGKETRCSVGDKPFLFKSAVWLYVARLNSDTKYARAAFRFIDKKIPDAVKHEDWILPVNTTGSQCPLKFKGDHWTLLHYSRSKNMWTFHNSIGASIDKDTHFQAVKILLDYIYERVQTYSDRTGTRIAMSAVRPGLVRSFDIPLQANGSLDCGPVVCYAIECMIWGKKIEKGVWTNDMGGEYRAHMLRVFYEVILRSGMP